MQGAAQRPQHQPAQCGEQQHRHAKAGHGDQAQRPIAAAGQQQQRESAYAQQYRQQRCRLELPGLAPDHAQWRRTGQLQHRRQAKGQQQGQPHTQAERQRLPASGRQGRLDQPGQQAGKSQVHQIAQQQPQHTAEHTQQHEFHRIGSRHGALAYAEHTQDGAIVQMARGKGTRGQRHGHGTQQRCQQRHQIQEVAGTVQRLLQLRVAAILVQCAHFNTAPIWLLQLQLGPLHIRLYRRLRPGQRQPVADPAGRLHQFCGRQIGHRDHHARGKTDQAVALVRLQRQYPAQAEGALAQHQRIAGAQAERIEQRRFGPGFAGGRTLRQTVIRHAVLPGRILAHAQLTDQRVPLIHRLE